MLAREKFWTMLRDELFNTATVSHGTAENHFYKRMQESTKHRNLQAQPNIADCKKLNTFHRVTNFLHCGVKLWNSLSTEAKRALTLGTFKNFNKLICILPSSVPLKYFTIFYHLLLAFYFSTTFHVILIIFILYCN